MNIIFYATAVIAVISTALAISRLNALHALLYLIVSLLSVAVIFFTIGAPFIAALEVIIYAGAIMVLFIFVVMILNLGEDAVKDERRMQSPGMWAGPGLLSALLLAELIYILTRVGNTFASGTLAIPPKAVGASLFGPYLLGVELSSILLMAGLVGAYHLGRRDKKTDRAH